ncbi:hypothetical protein TrVE_jg4872 [Triparma verrucosa]|uniref:EF-hand domain-containing protein n=1 Tax=Triparma verrucosa TaxID=1606542 RepID=A0A9W7DMB0_9STRA|nr:hypothetical protein TrVE_jg4872 [Triparma verrucosa]
MSRPTTAGFDEELIRTNAAGKYDGINEFLEDKPPEVDANIAKLAFNVMDTDRDELISSDDVFAAVKAHHVKLTKAQSEAMYLDALQTNFPQPVNQSTRPYKDKINIDDIISAIGFRKKSHDKTWVPRKMRDEWIILIEGLLPAGHRDRLFAPSPSPLFTPPALTNRERDTLNVSPIGFISSRPSSPGSTLSGYFSKQMSKGVGQQSSHTSSLQKPRFINQNNSRTNSRANSRAGGSRSSRMRGGTHNNSGFTSPIHRSPSVASILLKQRPRSRADGRLASISTEDTSSTNMAFDIVRATTPHLASARGMSGSMTGGRPMTTDGNSTLLSPSLSTMSLGTVSGGNMLGLTVQSPHETAFPSVSNSNNLPPTSPVFGFDSSSMNTGLKLMLNNSSILADKKTLGIKKYKQKKLKESMPVTKPEYVTVCGKATVSQKWRHQINKNAQQTLADNKGWSNKSDAHEKRLLWQDQQDLKWLRDHGKSQFDSFIHAQTLQAHKNNVAASQAGFFGKCNQGTFEINEPKPYIHEFRDWDRLPVFYN